MKRKRVVWASMILCFSSALGFAGRAGAQYVSGTSAAVAPVAGAAHDGRHDFDWDIGTWKVHMRRLLHPLAGSTTWVEYNGTDVVRKVWNGRANLGEVEVDSPAGHLELLTLRLYNPDSHQWSLNITNSASGSLSPPAVGEFRDGHAEFVDQESYKGRTILVRYGVSDITANSCRFDQAFSGDGGKTWEVNLIVDETLVKDERAHSSNGAERMPAVGSGKGASGTAARQ